MEQMGEDGKIMSSYVYPRLSTNQVLAIEYRTIENRTPTIIITTHIFMGQTSVNPSN